MAFMTQDPYTFDGTMRSNTTYGRDGATDANIHAAARMAAIHDDIMALEKQYDTTVVEGGSHHLSSITYADRIIVLEKGEDGCGVIVEEGTHEELKALEGVYAQLWESNSEEKNIEQIFSGGTPGTGLPNTG
ncbi:hypothetical protein CDV31_016646 [Fusarium ambrosium]|uniref:Uncharacterized protein n=1 Tax=Fusarium ambrosium TaxID=131363 RepID=A0A428S4V9_9HYPO|nr:hypothetical protein CDV31_016646 [Fusarium ambrosium]